jgi:hypothetical protein
MQAMDATTVIATICTRSTGGTTATDIIGDGQDITTATDMGCFIKSKHHWPCFSHTYNVNLGVT